MSLLLGVCSAYPRYVAVPLEDLDSFEFQPIADSRRILIAEESAPPPRFIASPYEDVEESQDVFYVDEPAGFRESTGSDVYEEQERPKRFSGGHFGGGGGGGDDKSDGSVDFGAYTGDHGAFGWYSDHPVGGGGGGGKKKNWVKYSSPLLIVISLLFFWNKSFLKMMK